MEHGIDTPSPLTQEAFRQRFRDLTIQFRENHRAWQEAVRVGDVPRQSALIARERAILTEVHEVIATFLDTMALPRG